jgi:hypothetical protein
MRRQMCARRQPLDVRVRCKGEDESRDPVACIPDLVDHRQPRLPAQATDNGKQGLTGEVLLDAPRPGAGQVFETLARPVPPRNEEFEISKSLHARKGRRQVGRWSWPRGWTTLLKRRPHEAKYLSSAWRCRDVLGKSLHSSKRGCGRFLTGGGPTPMVLPRPESTISRLASQLPAATARHRWVAIPRADGTNFCHCTHLQ